VLPPAQGAHPVVLLREVHEVEVAGERAGHLLGAAGLEGLHHALGLGERRRAGRGGGVDRQGAESLHVLQQAGAAGLGEHPAQQFAEEPHIRAQGLRHLVAGLVAGGMGGGGRLG